MGGYEGSVRTRRRRASRVIVGATRLTIVAAACLALGAGVARAARADVSADWSVSPNWSGYAATSPAGSTVSFTSATATWTVPKATCATKDAGAFSTIWVGLGGYVTTQKTEQVGTNSNCDAKGKPIYWAWFELAPYPAYTISNKVGVGDTITGTVKIVNQDFGVVQMQVQNLTRGWTFSRNINWSVPDVSSAEWIVSAPASCVRFVCHQASLANFGQAGMTGISAVGNAQTGTLTNPDWKVIPIQLVPATLNVPTLNPEAPGGGKGKAASPAGATPGPVSTDGSAFNIQWVAVASRGL